ncbi:MAG: tetratricopeptide repeat protein [Prevotellaceae bacterium]|jgi:tetratricopeptide (TPR) repeat protein|nr:tetratricopeptide repeat protein [Prevotellaceae bacterium]
MSKQIKSQDPEQAVGRTLSKAEQFLEKHKNTLLYALIAVVAVISVYFGYQRLYKVPLQDEARGQMFMAEQYFRVDSFALALNGDGNAYGFLQIRDEYGSHAGKILPFYIGCCQLHLGQYEEAIASLQSYKGTDEIVAARALACIGDAYAELGNLDEACSWFLKAANFRDNQYAARYLKKAATIREAQGNTAAALKLYEQIKLNYSQTAEGREVDKFIARLTN